MDSQLNPSLKVALFAVVLPLVVYEVVVQVVIFCQSIDSKLTVIGGCAYIILGLIVVSDVVLSSYVSLVDDNEIFLHLLVALCALNTPLALSQQVDSLQFLNFDQANLE
jgi:hypothetical protein